MKRLVYCVILAIGLPFAASSTLRAAEDDEVIKSVNGDLLKELLEEEGYKVVTVDKSSTDVHAVVLKMEGKTVVIICDIKKGDILCRFGISGTNANLRKVNQWNESKKFFKAHIDKDGDPAFEHILVVKHGVTRKAVKEHVSLMGPGIRAFLKEVCE